QDPIIISVPHISLLDNSPVKTRSKRNSANSTPSSSDQTTPVFHTTVNFDTPRTWISGKDNDFCENPPPFLGDNNMSYECETPFEFFMKIFPEKMYWSSVEGIKIPFIADNMTNNRFEEIKRNLHFASDEERVKGDGYWRVRPVLDILHQTFHEANDNSEHQAIDEMMIPFKGRNSLKQYLRNKPKKWGFKVWARAGVSGYIYYFEMYQGSDKSKRSKFGPIGDSVLRLCHDIHNLNIKLFMDNLFTSLPLLTELKNNGIFVLGTLRLNRVKNIQSYLVAGKLLPRGASS
ncbi:piggyBac transposable element-derived protein 3-like, partial [Aphis craccivora]